LGSDDFIAHKPNLEVRYAFPCSISFDGSVYPYYSGYNPNPLAQLFPCGPTLVPSPGSGLIVPFALAQSGFGSGACAPFQAFLLSNRMNAFVPFGGNSFNWGLPADPFNPMAQPMPMGGGGPFAPQGIGAGARPFGGGF
jgi:hypothetical protein